MHCAWPWDHADVPPPFVCYLRVYEPLAAFEQPARLRLLAAIESGPLSTSDVGGRERELWLRAQLAAPPRMLPGDSAEGEPPAELPLDVLVLDPATVDGVTGDAKGPLVCPLDLRTRAAAALVGFLATASPPLVRVALPVGPRAAADAVRSRAETVVSELGSSAVHVVSSTWTVPLPWFALVLPGERRMVDAPRPDPARRVSWRVPLLRARSRATRAHRVVRGVLGDVGPTRVLGDTNRWLSHFHPDSVVELDYGGLVQLMDDEAMRSDTSAADVQAVVDALEDGRTAHVAEHYERLRDFWSEMAAFERFG
jgi:hypothetical protein